MRLPPGGRRGAGRSARYAVADAEREQAVPLPHRILIYVIFFSIPGLLLFIVPTLKLGGGGGGGTPFALVNSNPRTPATVTATPRRTGAESGGGGGGGGVHSYKNNDAESELLLGELGVGLGEIADDFLSEFNSERERKSAAAKAEAEAAAAADAAADMKAAAAVNAAAARNAAAGARGGNTPGTTRGNTPGNTAGSTPGIGMGMDMDGKEDNGLGEFADPEEDATTPLAEHEVGRCRLTLSNPR
jgi:hypothetical protein